MSSLPVGVSPELTHPGDVFPVVVRSLLLPDLLSERNSLLYYTLTFIREHDRPCADHELQYILNNIGDMGY